MKFKVGAQVRIVRKPNTPSRNLDSARLHIAASHVEVRLTELPSSTVYMVEGVSDSGSARLFPLKGSYTIPYASNHVEMHHLVPDTPYVLRRRRS